MNDRDRRAAAARVVETPWAAEADDVLAALGADPTRGLASADIAARRARHGANVLRTRKPRRAWRILIDQFLSLVVALLAAAALAAAIFGRPVEALAIVIVLALNAAIGFVTELKAVRSMEALRGLGQATAKVRRDGTVREIPAIEIVLGDLVVLEAGDVVTADLRLVEASKLAADESTLTGESLPVTKDVAASAAEAILAERRSMLHKGTAVVRGSALGVTMAVGMGTELGRIAQLASEAEHAATPLERRLAQLARRLVWITLAIAAATLGVGIARGKDPLLMLETAIALAVAAIPEGLPIVATLALARGMWRMARHRVVVNRLSAVETLGATGVILTDKTGTLTENRMAVAHLTPSGAELDAAGLERAASAPPSEALRRLLEAGALCSNAQLPPAGSDAPPVGDPLEVALLECARRFGIERAALLEAHPELREEAFDPAVRAMATVHADGAGVRIAVKGAAETVVPRCTRTVAAPLDDAARSEWLDRSRRLADAGLRVLALAERTADAPDAPCDADLVLLGLAGLRDPPRPDVPAALAACTAAGVRVVMVTGDQAGTALSIARAVGLVSPDHAAVIEGRDIPRDERLDPAAHADLLAAPIFARVEPEQKLRLIALHQATGAIVAMTGDGVNDAPALRKADIGVAMGRRGTQVAREAAAMVLADDDLGAIVHAIRHGRVIFANLRRFVLYLLSCNVSEIAIVVLASAVGAPLPVLPLQILFLNLVTDVFPALALGFGEGDPDAMSRPPRDPREAIVTRRHWILIGAWGLVIAVAVLGAFMVALLVLRFPERRAVTTSFLALALAQVFHVVDLRGPTAPLLRNDIVGNRWIWGAAALCVVLLVAAVHLPALAAALGTEPPGASGWMVAIVAGAVPVVVGLAWRRLRPAC